MIELDLPDEPRYVEAHGMARDPGSWSRPLGRGFAIGNDAARLIVLLGDVGADDAIAVARAHPHHAVLCMTEALGEALRGAGRGVERAILYGLPEPGALPDLEGAARATEDTSLEHLPAGLAEELAAPLARGELWAVWVDGEPVSFAYAPWRSERWFDVSVDTLASARQLGLGQIVASAMIHDERARGREPVWGANEGNVASRRLADRLGFAAIDELWVAAPGMAAD